jgi:hypothetical protein
VKINWDAFVDKGRNLMGMGIMVRDCEGRLIAALCIPQNFIVDPATAEALAAWKMVKFCINMEFGKVYLEGNCLEVVQALNFAGDDWGRYGPLINDTRELLRRVQIQHVPRVCNKAAHQLARFALTCSEEIMWRGDVLACISEVISANQAGVLMCQESKKAKKNSKTKERKKKRKWRRRRNSHLQISIS